MISQMLEFIRKSNHFCKSATNNAENCSTVQGNIMIFANLVSYILKIGVSWLEP